MSTKLFSLAQPDVNLTPVVYDLQCTNYVHMQKKTSGLLLVLQPGASICKAQRLPRVRGCRALTPNNCGLKDSFS